MNQRIKEIVDASKIKLVKVKHEEKVPEKLSIDNKFEEYRKALRKGALNKISAQMLPFLEVDNFKAASHHEHRIVRLTGEVVICNLNELTTILEKVYDAGKTDSIIETSTPYNDLSL